jgi:Domain of unknown function (DUF4470)
MVTAAQKWLPHTQPHAGRPEFPDAEYSEKLGTYCADGPSYTSAMDEGDLAVSLDPPATPAKTGPAADAEMSTGDGGGRRDVSVLLGGCGDARHFLATLLDAAECPKPQRFRLRAVLNDNVPEAVARVYLLLVLLDRAADALPGGDTAAIDYDHLPDAAVRALTCSYALARLPVRDAERSREVGARRAAGAGRHGAAAAGRLRAVHAWHMGAARGVLQRLVEPRADCQQGALAGGAHAAVGGDEPAHDGNASGFCGMQSHAVHGLSCLFCLHASMVCVLRVCNDTTGKSARAQ